VDDKFFENFLEQNGFKYCFNIFMLIFQVQPGAKFLESKLCYEDMNLIYCLQWVCISCDDFS
jgi:hypothetical protein